ncbi:MAG TPA: hypothetical protein VHE57_15300 [Mycobacteriales bacterium]|nr:hypothetical protein [Mycobacteriales bacterium]
MANRRGSVVISTLDAHPNALEILSITSQLPCITDLALAELAGAWQNTSELAEARRHALEPDSPLVFDALAAFETVQVIFAEEIRGGEEYLTVEPEVASTALKAVRDAIAGAYARPVLSPTEHAALTRAWRAVYPNDRLTAPDLGNRGADVNTLLQALPRLAATCHDREAMAEHAAIVKAVASLDEDIRCAAREEAWHAAILTSRRRIWHLVRHTGEGERKRYCHPCRERARDADTDRVLRVCIDAACGLLVAGALEDDIVDVLTAPVDCLLSTPRPATEG